MDGKVWVVAFVGEELGNATGFPQIFAGLLRVLINHLIALRTELIAKKKSCKSVKKWVRYSHLKFWDLIFNAHPTPLKCFTVSFQGL